MREGLREGFMYHKTGWMFQLSGGGGGKEGRQRERVGERGKKLL